MDFKRIIKAYEDCIDELRGSIDYSKAAIDMKNNNAQFSKMFHEMAIDEVKHAGYLKSMIEKTLETMKNEGSFVNDLSVIIDYNNDKYYKKLVKAKIMIQYYEGKV